ncbi:hypothetical protein [Cohnella soli]|uniref:AP2/ERF domain-containing protein n=1 Tax=Cohnella soli TaxID=425005 RepID=A0ABW0HKE5_9BACL
MISIDKVKSSSQYTGVSWNKSAKAWEARLFYEGKYLYLGNWNNEQWAAERYDEEVIDLKMNKPTNLLPNPYYKPLETVAEKRESTYKGVRWSLRAQRWEVRHYDKEDKKQSYIGVFENEKEAAKAYDRYVFEAMLSRFNFPEDLKLEQKAKRKKKIIRESNM